MCPGIKRSAGLGTGGQPGRSGENCEPKGNGLIIQSWNSTIPDASHGEGVITFHFDPPVPQVTGIGFLNIVGDSDFLEITDLSGTYQIQIEGLGVNAVQRTSLSAHNARTIAFHMHGPRVITNLDFCSTEASLPSKKASSSSGKKDDIAPVIYDIPVDDCTFKDSQSMIEILDHSSTNVTFLVHPVWDDDCNSSMPSSQYSWMAVDYLTPNFGVHCVSSIASCLQPMHITADCDNNLTVVDVYARHAHRLGQSQGQLIEPPPPACGLSPKTQDMCHFRFLLKCSPEAKEPLRRRRLLEIFWWL
jgi:hypothetical protein